MPAPLNSSQRHLPHRLPRIQPPTASDRARAAAGNELDRARLELAGRGWTLICGAPFLRRGRPDERAVLDLASGFGIASARDGGRAVWPVTPRADGSGSTFSTRTGPAGFHTDAQYHDDPEDLVCLFAVRPAARGGQTRLLGYNAAVDSLLGTPDGTDLLTAMRRPIWRWQAPSGFGTLPGGPGMAPAAVLPGDGCLRWRADNLAPLPPDEPPAAAARIDEAFESAPGQVRLDLDRGDLLIIDNHRVMHARTAFTDPRRLLLRVRLWGDR